MASGPDAVIGKNFFLFFNSRPSGKVQRINKALDFTSLLDIYKSHSRKGHEEKYQG